ncbi:MAG: TIM barrel protein [Deltaproteobacteria bacterium]|nr:TIM barrel protein [Deltaproteobacteria bacterium]
MYPQLPKSYKNAYPFRISAPSFIYPDDYIPNVRMLGPFLDEIELLCFESHESALPSRKTIHELESLAREFRFTYNVHLPTDIDPGSPDRKEKNRFIETLLRVMDLTLPLAPTTYTLHLPCNQAPIERMCDKAWQDRISESMGSLMDAGVRGPSLSVETLDYPLEWLDEILQKYDLRVCLDIGHLIANHENIETTYQRFAGQTTMIHLHGVDNGKDHQALDAFDQSRLDRIFSIIKRFTGTISLEVFSYDHLLASLAVLEKNMR